MQKVDSNVAAVDAVMEWVVELDLRVKCDVLIELELGEVRRLEE